MKTKQLLVPASDVGHITQYRHHSFLAASSVRVHINVHCFQPLHASLQQFGSWLID